jgi:4-cresol dehydrogenase (hydroxylating)
LDGRIAADVAALATDTFAEQGMTAYTTLNIVSAKALESVINLAFDRRDEEASARAAKAIDNLHERLMEQGLIPYRTSIRMMDRITDENDTFWQTVRDLKKVLDPNGIIAPGRYNLV